VPLAGEPLSTHNTTEGDGWVENFLGYSETLGRLADMPVCVSLRTAVVRGHKLLFIDPTSQVVDHRLIDEWLEEWLPPTARRGSVVNKVDAANFHNVFPRKREEVR
jgi:hypothetical protein